MLLVTKIRHLVKHIQLLEFVHHVVSLHNAFRLGDMREDIAYIVDIMHKAVMPSLRRHALRIRTGSEDASTHHVASHPELVQHIIIEPPVKQVHNGVAARVL